MEHRSRFARRLCVAVDAASYSSLDSVAQYDLQSQLSRALDEAAAAARLDRSQWLRQPQGDGELALVPHDQPEPRVVDDFIRELDAALRLLNHGRVPASRLRLRVAIDFGVAYEAECGFAGDAVIATARLLASESLHRVLAQAPDADLAVALSANVYQTVLDRHTSLTPEQFSAADVREKEFRGKAWIRVFRSGTSTECAAPMPDTAASHSVPPQSPRGADIMNIFNDTVHAGVIGYQSIISRDGRR
jgi:hypothetical protein